MCSLAYNEVGCFEQNHVITSAINVIHTQLYATWCIGVLVYNTGVLKHLQDIVWSINVFHMIGLLLRSSLSWLHQRLIQIRSVIKCLEVNGTGNPIVHQGMNYDKPYFKISLV